MRCGCGLKLLAQLVAVMCMCGMTTRKHDGLGTTGRGTIMLEGLGMTGGRPLLERLGVTGGRPLLEGLSVIGRESQQTGRGWQQREGMTTLE